MVLENVSSEFVIGLKVYRAIYDDSSTDPDSSSLWFGPSTRLERQRSCPAQCIDLHLTNLTYSKTLFEKFPASGIAPGCKPALAMKNDPVRLNNRHRQVRRLPDSMRLARLTLAHWGRQNLER